MKTSNVNQGRAHHEAIIRGWVSPNRAGSTGITLDDGTTSTTGITGITVIGGTIIDNGDGTVTITIEGPSDALLRAGGEQHAVDTESDAGASISLDFSASNWFDLTLTTNCTISFTGTMPASGDGGEWTIILRQGGTGSYTVTWPAEVEWQDTDGTTGGSAPTLYTAVGAVDELIITTLDGGTTFGGAQQRAGSGSSLTVQDEGTPLATAATTLNFVGSGVTASGTGATKTITISSSVDAATISALGFVGPILIADSPSTPLVFGDLLQNDAQDDLMYADL